VVDRLAALRDRPRGQGRRAVRIAHVGAGDATPSDARIAALWATVFIETDAAAIIARELVLAGTWPNAPDVYRGSVRTAVEAALETP
jgi:hypothetical protein